jgi:hypothetical protein
MKQFSRIDLSKPRRQPCNRLSFAQAQRHHLATREELSHAEAGGDFACARIPAC